MDSGEEEEGQVVVVGLRPVSLDGDGDDDVCYTELKPSTTLLLPIELSTEHQELLHSTELPEVALPVGSNDFSLMLEADDEESAALEMDAENPPSLEMNTEHAGEGEGEPHANMDNIEHTALEPEGEMLKLEELPKEAVVPDVVEQEMIESEPYMEDQPEEPAEEVQKQIKSEIEEPEPLLGDELDEPADEVQAEQTEEYMEVRPDSDPVDDGEAKEKPVKPADNPTEVHVKKPVIEVTFDVTDACVSTHSDMPGVEDELVLNEKMPGKECDLETSKMVPVAEDQLSDGQRVEAKPEKDAEATAELKELHQSPARRGRKTVSFPVTMESEKDAWEDERAESKVISTPRRVTRSSILESEVLITPRRSTRKTVSEVTEAEVPSTKATPPRKTPQKATPTRGARRTRSSSKNYVEELQNKEQTSVVEHQSARKTRQVTIFEVPEPLSEEKSLDNTNASPSRVTRQSSRRLSLTLESFQMISDVQNKSLVTPPRSRRKTRGVTVEKANNETHVVESAPLQNVSRRLTRSRHWNEEEEPEKPEELKSANLLESTLMERLNNEQANESEVVTEIVRAKRRTRSVVTSVEHEAQKAEVPESTKLQEQKNKSALSVRRTRSSKAPEPEGLPVSDETPGALSRRGERPLSLTLYNYMLKFLFHFKCFLFGTGKKKDVAVHDIVLSPPVTRMRRTAPVPDGQLEVSTSSC